MADLFRERVNLKDNEKREIDNPLAHVQNLDDLDELAKHFARRINSETPDYTLWIKAVRVARDPLGAKPENVPELTQQEYHALLREKHVGFWSQPKPLRVAIATLCLGMVLSPSISNNALLYSIRNAFFECATNTTSQAPSSRVGPRLEVGSIYQILIKDRTNNAGNGANQSWPQQMGLKDSDNNWKDNHSIWIFSGVNAVTYLAASFFGCW
jgi:hypothetical protein